ncbi:MAG: hypothetical protein ACJAVR_000374 [Paracoccaceae bacterium]|jgi:hypothetical protein
MFENYAGAGAFDSRATIIDRHCPYSGHSLLADSAVKSPSLFSIFSDIFLNEC